MKLHTNPFMKQTTTIFIISNEVKVASVIM